MTQALRDAAQALHDIVMQQCGATHLAGPGFEAAEKARVLRAALDAPAPSPDERVAEHMRLVHELFPAHANLNFVAHTSNWEVRSASEKFSKAKDAVESSARALLGAAQEDAEHAAMYRWLTESSETGSNERCIMKDKLRYLMCFQYFCTSQELDAAIRAAMKEQKA